MRITARYLGKPVRLVWRDPIASCRMSLDRVPKGAQALASWTEYGVVGDITDGIVRVDHSQGENPPLDNDRGHEVMSTWIHEALVENIVELTEKVEAHDPTR